MLLTLQSSAQDLFSKVFYHETYGIHTTAMCRTTDNNYILAGWKDNATSLIIKFNETGDLIWSKQIAEYYTVYRFTDIIATQDSGCIIVGYGEFMNENISGGIIIKVNSAGEVVWSRLLYFDKSSGINSICETIDHGFAITGIKGVTDWGQGSEMFVARYDSTGSPMWCIIPKDQFMVYNGNGYAIKQMPDSTFIVTGFFSGTVLMNFDVDGSVIWAKEMDDPDGSFSRSRDILVMEDGIYCYFVNDDGRVVLLKTDFAGNAFWIKRFDSYDINNEHETRSRIKPASDGGVLFITSGFSEGSLNKVDPSGEAVWKQDLMLLAVDIVQSATNGYILAGNGPLTGVMKDDIYQPQIGIIQTDSIGNGALCTWSSQSQSYDYPASLINIDFPVDCWGSSMYNSPTLENLPLLTQEGCVTFIGAVDENKPDISPLQISPNPAKNTFRIEFEGIENHLFQQVEIKDALGRTVYSTSEPACLENGISTEGLKPGIYHVRLTTNKAYFVGRLIISD